MNSHTDTVTHDQELEQSLCRLAGLFRNHCEEQPTPADIATLMLSREVNLLTMQLDRIESRLAELIEPFKTSINTPRH